MLLVAAAWAHSAELGDINVRSFIGQPLAADIELVSLSSDEAVALQARLASVDVFRGANIAMNPALSTVRMTIVKRDQKQFLHVTTTHAVDADYVHLYVELGAAGRQEVRLATVWLQPDPNPAPVPAAAAPVAVAAQDAAPIPGQARVEHAAVPLARDRTRPAPLPSQHESEVGVAGALKSAAASSAPSQARLPGMVAVRDIPAQIAQALGTSRPAAASTQVAAPAKPLAKQDAGKQEAATKETAKQEAAKSEPGKREVAKLESQKLESAKPEPAAPPPLKVAQALLPLPPLPLPAGVKRPTTPAACAPTSNGAKECKALDTHSLALTSKLAELEGKMKSLQVALKAPVPADAAATTTAAAAPATKPAAPAHASASSLGEANAATMPAHESKPATSEANPARPAAKSLPADGKPATPDAEAHPSAASVSAAASASASAAAADASAPPVPMKRVLPKLKYKKEKPAEKPASALPWIIGGVGVALLALAGLVFWRRKKSGAGPLKIWQGFRKKTVAEPAAKPQEAHTLQEATPEALPQ